MKQHKRNWYRGLVFGLVLVMLAVVVALSGRDATAGPQYKESVNGDITQIVPNEIEALVYDETGQYKADGGAPVALYQVNYPVRPDATEAMARQYLADNAAALQLRQPDLSDLAERFTRTGPAGTTVRFAQSYEGIPVYKSEVVVHLNNNDMVSFYTNSYKHELALANLTPDLSAAEARQMVFDYLGVEGPLQLDTSRLVVYYLAGHSYLAYEIRVIAGVPLGDWEALVDAHSGELLKVADVAAYQDSPGDNDLPTLVDGNGNVFDPDPLTSATATYGDTGYIDGNDANTPQLIAEQFNVTLPDIQFAGGMYTLIGPWAEIVDTEAPFNGLFAQATSTWNFNRFDDDFEAANVYYQIDQSMRYLNITLGVPVVPFQYSGGARFDPHGLNGADNSHYSGGSGVVAFGEGGVDDSEDADVIIHELGHGLHDWITGGALSQVNGLSEGTGDYWAESYSRSLGYWTPADPQYYWVFGWDGHNPFWGGRVTNYPNLWPGGLVGQIHTDGQIWSSVNLEIFELIGRAKIDTAFWEGLANTTFNTDQNQAANAVFQAAIDMNYSTSDLLVIRDRYTARGYIIPALPVPDFALGATPASQAICAGDSADYEVDVQSILGFGGTVTLSATGNPAGSTTNFSPNGQAAPYTSTLTIGNTGGVTADTYTIQVSGQDITGTIHTADVDLNVATVPAAINLTGPADGSTGVALMPTFTWDADSQADTYTLEVATDAGFSNIVVSETGISGTSFTLTTALDTDAEYFWRVQGDNSCGAGTFSPVFSFMTMAESFIYLPMIFGE